jgi:hypothetical protein
MCSACAATAIAAASGTRTWLRAQGWAWLTPRRLRAITITLAVLAVLVPSVRFSGSSAPTAPHPSAPAAAASR